MYLNEFQTRILQQLSEGWMQKEIAAFEGVALAMIRRTLDALRLRYGIRTVQQLMAVAAGENLIKPKTLTEDEYTQRLQELAAKKKTTPFIVQNKICA